MYHVVVNIAQLLFTS